MYDVIIVGAGVAGSYLASKLEGLNVLLIEKDKNPVLKDSGIVSEDFLEFFDGPIRSGIKRMDCFSPSGDMFTLYRSKPFAYVLEREAFAKVLKSKARVNARIVYDTVKDIKQEKDFVLVETPTRIFKTRIVVGADGANSTVRRSVGIESPQLSVGVMVKTRKIDGHINVFFNKHYSPDFFSWIIPQNNEYGLITSMRPRECLEYFKDKQYLPPGKVIAHLVPTGYTKSYSHRTILLGDACGHNKPLTGGGIMFGLKAAGYAADTIKEAFSREKFSGRVLGKYEAAWKKDLAWEIRKQFLVRRFYRNLTNRQIDKIFSHIGNEIEKLPYFDYDKFSKSWMRMSKYRLFKAFMSSI